MLNKMAREINVNSHMKGFWDDMNISIEKLQSHNIEYGCPNNDEKATKDAYISQKLLLVISEISEATEAMRSNKYGLEEKNTFEDELADSIIRILDLCAELNIDIEKQIDWKMKINKQREYKHSKNF